MKMFVLLCLFTFASCGESSKTEPELTKEQARKSAKADDGTDFCEENGWYGDGTCDSFCTKADVQDCHQCGGPDDLQCPTDFVCAPPVGTCGQNNLLGTCVSTEEKCSIEIAPVCGCDGKTYKNLCLANQANIPIDREGDCLACGGPNDIKCAEGLVCEYLPGQCGTKAHGQCVVPEKCSGIAPVCGCDGKTYSNSCSTTNAGILLAHDGEC